MNQSRFPALFSVILLLTVACRREKEAETTSPSYRIRQSETLAIPAAVDLPANLPTGNTRVATFYAEGVQKYKAQLKAGSNPAAYEWVFVAPQAKLYDAHNRNVGTHGAGPFWQLSASDSIFGQAYNPPRTAPATTATDVDWLLLAPKTGKAATGMFAGVSYIQRVATRGGKAPVTPPASATEITDVPYTAVYRFSRENL